MSSYYSDLLREIAMVAGHLMITRCLGRLTFYNLEIRWTAYMQAPSRYEESLISRSVLAPR